MKLLQAKELINKNKSWNVLRARKDFTYVFPNEPFMRKYCEYANKLLAPEKIEFILVDIVNNKTNQLSLPSKPLEKAGNLFFEKVKKDKNLISNHFEDFKKEAERLTLFQERFVKLEVKKENLKQISTFYREFIEKIVDIVPKGIVIWVSINGPLSNKIKSYLLEKIKNEQQATETLACLIQPLEPSFSYLERKELLEIIERFSLENNSNLDNPHLEKELAAHSKKYEWLPYEFIGPNILTLESAKEEIKEILERDWRKEKEKNSFFLEQLKNNQKLLIKEYQIEQEITEYIKIAQELAVYFDYRKMIFSKICLAVSRFYEKLSKFYKLGDWKDLFWLTPEEILDFISKGEFSKELVEKRKEFVLTVFTLNKTKTFQGGEARELASLILADSSSSDRIIGQLASKADKKEIMGKARVLLSPTQVREIKQGEILVAVMTNPAYIAAMRKSSAIVTDEGGITSHAAIVSRELGIPAIIGTKSATKLIKTGDKIKLNLETGEVVILK